MDTHILQEIGMTHSEIKIYISLIKMGTATAGPILDNTKLQNSVVHLTLNKLLKKGFVTYIKKGHKKHYSASDPKILLKVYEERKLKLKQLVTTLEAITPNKEKQEAEIYEGFKGFKSMLYEFIKEAKPNDEYLYFAFHTENPNDFEFIYTFYKDFEKERKKRGLHVKGLAPKSIKKKFKGRDLKGIKFVETPIPTNISICNNKVLFTPWENGQTSFVITSTQLANSLRAFFYSVWDQENK